MNHDILNADFVSVRRQIQMGHPFKRENNKVPKLDCS